MKKYILFIVLSFNFGIKAANAARNIPKAARNIPKAARSVPKAAINPPLNISIDVPNKPIEIINFEVKNMQQTFASHPSHHPQVAPLNLFAPTTIPANTIIDLDIMQTTVDSIWSGIFGITTDKIMHAVNNNLPLDLIGQDLSKITTLDRMLEYLNDAIIVTNRVVSNYHIPTPAIYPVLVPPLERTEPITYINISDILRSIEYMHHGYFPVKMNYPARISGYDTMDTDTKYKQEKLAILNTVINIRNKIYTILYLKLNALFPLQPQPAFSA